MHRQTLRELQQTAVYQRKLLGVAVALLRPGGALVFSTCSINPGAWRGDGGGAGGWVTCCPEPPICGAPPPLGPALPLRAAACARPPSPLPARPPARPLAGENEANVRWLLDSHPDMELVPQAPRLGQPGLAGARGAGACTGLRNITGRRDWVCVLGGPSSRCVGVDRESPPTPAPLSCAGEVALPDGSMQRLLTPAEAALVQRFDPSAELDTIGFFVAKFRKRVAPAESEAAAAAAAAAAGLSGAGGGSSGA